MKQHKQPRYLTWSEYVSSDGVYVECSPGSSRRAGGPSPDIRQRFTVCDKGDATVGKAPEKIRRKPSCSLLPLGDAVPYSAQVWNVFWFWRQSLQP
jgi:hypothetical protein